MTRRSVLARVLAAAAAVGVTGCASGAAHPPSRPGDTRARTLADPVGDARLRARPGEPVAAPAGRTLATLAIVTDAHVRDEESPARVPFLDRLGAPFTSTFRPQEALTAQVLAAAARAIAAEHPDAVLEAGDLADSAQSNELTMGITALRGGTVHPDSGAPGYDGPQLPTDPDPSYYRPDVDPPVHRGLLDAAQRPFRSPGVGAPWFPVAGNHDLLVDGEIPRTARTNAIATGDRVFVAPPLGFAIPRVESLAPAAVDRLLARGVPGRTRRVPADPARRELSPAAAVARLHAASAAVGRPLRAPGHLDSTADLGPDVRLVVLDTVSRGGGAGPVVDAAQAAWLRAQLRAAGRRWVLVASHQPLAQAAGAGAADLHAALRADPRVLALLCGHTHRHRITRVDGHWSITTASLADFPQQTRMLRIVRTPSGIALVTWVLDTAPEPLADTARELAFLDAQGGRPAGFRGRRADRNRVLRVPAR